MGFAVVAVVEAVALVVVAVVATAAEVVVAADLVVGAVAGLGLLIPVDDELQVTQPVHSTGLLVRMPGFDQCLNRVVPRSHHSRSRLGGDACAGVLQGHLYAPWHPVGARCT